MRGRMLSVGIVAILLFSLIPLPVYSAPRNTILYVDFFSSDQTESEIYVGPTPYLNNNTSNRISGRGTGTYGFVFWDSHFFFADLEESGAKEIDNVTLHFETYLDINIDVYLSLHNGISWGSSHYIAGGSGGAYKWFNFSVYDELNTEGKVDACRMRIYTDVGFLNLWYYYRRAYLNVTFREVWYDPSPPFEDYIPIGMGFFGLGVLAFLPLFLVFMLRRKKKVESWIPYVFMLFFIAIGCVIGWLWG